MPIPKLNPKGLKLKMKADEAYNQQKWKKAIDLYQEASTFLLNDPRIEQRIGDLFRRLRMNEEAIQQYKKVAKMFANDGFWAKAIAINKLILELDPDDHTVQRQLAEMYSSQGTKSRTIKEAKPGERPEALSISGSAPLSADMLPENDSFIGGTLSIRGEEPRTLDQGPEGVEPIELSAESEVVDDLEQLGTPLGATAKIPLLSDMKADEVAAFLERLAIRRYPEQSLICEEGDVGRSMYIIADGIVEVFTRDANGSRLVLKDLHGGDFFGEFGLLTNGQRNASVQAKSEVELMEITNVDFDAIAARHPRIWNVLEEYLRKRMIDTILTKSPVFRAMAQDERHELTSFVKLKKMKSDETVMQEGTAGEEMFFVKSGKLVVTVTQEKDLIVVGELGPGDYFGEVAMLTGKPRTATVRTKTECELFTLTRKDAAKVLRNNREVLQRLKSKMEDRAKETAEVSKSYQEAKTTLELV